MLIPTKTCVTHSLRSTWLVLCMELPRDAVAVFRLLRQIKKEGRKASSDSVILLLHVFVLT